MAKWVLDFYQGEQEYSDGSIEQELLDIVKSGKNLNNVIEEDDRWPVLYHFSPLRENIVNWYPFDVNGSILEIGAGCGAITGALCRAAKSVTSVELTKIRSEINYERNKQYDNWTLITGNFHNIHFDHSFDYIILNGVFEYAISFTNTDNPYTDFLKEIRTLLSPRGKVLIAIENRLGIKYFNGVREDHTNEFFSGLNCYKDVDFVRTFSKNRLIQILKSAGFNQSKFYYPIDDYKFPQVILTDKSIDFENFNIKQDNFNATRLRFFDEKEMMRSLKNEGVLDHFLNSFLVETTCDGILSDVIYAKISNRRAPEFAINTIIKEKSNENYIVTKEGLNPKSITHIKKMLQQRDHAIDGFVNLKVNEITNGIEMPFVPGVTLEHELIQYLKHEQFSEFKALLRHFCASLRANSYQVDSFNNVEFQSVFGKTMFTDLMECKRNLNIDCVFGNIIHFNDKYIIIDYEWCFDFDVPVYYVIWRIIKMFWSNNASVRKYYSLEAIQELVQIKEEWLPHFEQWEQHFLYQYVKSLDLSRYEKLNFDGKNEINKLINSQLLVSTIYYDIGNGFNEENALSVATEIGKDGKLSLVYDFEGIIGQIKALRWDPCETKCKIRNLTFSNGIHISTTNQIFKDDEWSVFLTDDPSYNLEFEANSIEYLSIHAEIQLISHSEQEEYYTKTINMLKMNEEQILALREENDELQKLNWKNWMPVKIARHSKNMIKNQKNGIKSIKYAIDSISEIDRKIVARGWAFSVFEKTPVDFAIIGDKVKDVYLRRITRNDTKDIFDLLPDQKYGFELLFDERWKNKHFILKLYDGRFERFISLDLTGKKYQRKQLVCSFKEESRKQFKGMEQKSNYRNWIKKTERDLSIIQEEFEYNPKISILVPVYNVKKNLLHACVESVLAQTYQNWELCLVDDCSTLSYIPDYLKALSKDKRIIYSVRERNGHISKSSNDALSLATGEFIALLDNDDTLAPFALSSVVEMLNKHRQADLIYSDEDKINLKEVRSNPFFKPDWSPDTLLSQNYICHLMVIRKTLVDKVGGFEIGMEGAQDYDLALKCTELTDEIYHIPRILYHWRMTETSTAENPEAKEYAFDAGKQAIKNALKRRGKSGVVKQGSIQGTYIVNYHLIDEPKVSIIIPTKNHAADLEKCIESIVKTSDYTNFEIVIIDNGSDESALFELYDYYKQRFKGSFRVLTLDIPFNFSKLNNEAVKEASGEYLLFLNNDIEMISKDWLSVMLGYAQQKHIGAVGAKLYYPDNTIQHAGVVLGIGGVAGHSHKYLTRTDPGYFARVIIPSDYAAVTAACLMVKKSRFDEVQGFEEERLTVAFNDVDFCLKLFNKGYYNVCLPQVEAYHYESKSRGVEDTAEKQNRFMKEIDYMVDKWGELLLNDPFYNINLSLRKEDFSIKDY